MQLLLPGEIWNLPFWQCLYIPFEALTAIRMAANRRACVFGWFSVVILIMVCNPDVMVAVSDIVYDFGA